jgi:hypothetical protein
MGVTIKTCDDTSVITTRNWYRFNGPAGSRMLDTCPTGKCNADFQGWLKEGQPGMLEFPRVKIP